MLAENLKILLASTNALAIKAQNFHWNVEGSNFPQYHAFFETYYNDVYGTVDRIAEYVRALDSYTPGSLARYAELSVIGDQVKIPRAELMFAELLEDTNKMTEVSKQLFSNASDVNEQGIANFMAELQDLYTKKAWFIRSILKKERE